MTIAKAKVFWPVTIDGTNHNLPIKITGSTTYTATLASATYLSAVLLAAAVQTAIRAVGGGTVFNNMVVSVDSTGHFVFTDSLDPAFTLDWGARPSVALQSILGFFTLDVVSSANVATAPKQHTNGWYSPVATREDSLPIRDRSADTVTLALSGQSKFITESELTKREVTFSYLAPEKTYIFYEGAGNNVNQAIENWWISGRAKFRYWPDGTIEATYVDYILAMQTIQEFAPKRLYPKKALYEVQFNFRGYVA